MASKKHPFRDNESVSRFLATDAEVENVANAIGRGGFDVEVLRYPKNTLPMLKKIIESYEKPSIFWNLSDGDDYFIGSKVPAFAEFIRKPYIGSNTFTQALAQNKHYTKLLLGNAGIPTADGLYLTNANYESESAKLHSFRYPCFIKPAAFDNSVAYEKYSPIAYSEEEAVDAVRKLFAEKIESVLIEEFLPGMECTVPSLHSANWDLLAIEQTYPGEFLGVEVKEEIGPEFIRKNFALEENHELVHLAERVIELMSIKDYCRMDFRADGSGIFKFMEVNTGTFLTTASFTKYAAVKYGGDQTAMFSDLITHSYGRQIKAHGQE